MTIGTTTFAGDAVFTVTDTQDQALDGQTIAAGADLAATISFTPDAIGDFSATLTVTSDGGNVTVDVAGEGYIDTHFDPIDEQVGQYHDFTINSATITSYPVEGDYTLGAGDEIGVFDGDICVGAAYLSETLVDPVDIQASGFTVNHDFTFYLYDVANTRELLASYTWISGPTVFRNQDPLGATVVDLTADFEDVFTFNNSVTINSAIQNLVNNRYFRDNGNVAGFDGSANDDYDLALDAPEPSPPENSYISTYFPHGAADTIPFDSPFGDNFMYDIRETADLTNDVAVYEFYVDTDITGLVEMSFTANEDYNTDYGIVLYDVDSDSFQNLRDTDVYNFASNPAPDPNIHDLFYLRLGDATAPVTAYAAPVEDEILYGAEDYTLQWSFTDVTELKMANIFYSTDDGQSWTVFDQTNDMVLYRPDLGDNTYDWTVPQTYSMYSKLRIESEDWAGNVDTTDTDYTFKLAPTASSYPFLGDSWYLFSVPLVLDDANTGVDYVFGDGTHFVYDYVASQGYGLIQDVNQGPGYWVANSDFILADITGDAEIDSTVLTLNTDWNIVGCGLPTTLLKNNDLYFTNDGGITIRTFEEAWSGDPAWISRFLYAYEDGTYALADTLEQWQGYWLQALVENLEMITYAPYPGPAAEAGGEIDEFNENNWTVPITIRKGDAVDRLAAIGVNEEANNTFDRAFDVPTPPASPAADQIRMVFNHPEWNAFSGSNFSQDVRTSFNEENVSQNWFATIEASQPGIVTVTFEGISDLLPEGYIAVVHHEGGDVNLMESESFSFYYTEPYDIEIQINSETSVNPHYAGIPEEFAIQAAYPNPFNPSVNVVVAVPQATKMTAVVYDMLGREVAQLETGYVQAGYQTLTWTANGPTGLYFLRISTDTGWNAVQKLMYLK